MTLALFCLLAFALVGLLPRSGAAPRAEPPAFLPARDGLVACAALLTAGSFAFWTRVIDAAAHAQVPLPAWLASLPLLAIDDRAPRFGHAPFGTFAGLAALLGTIGLGGLFATLHDRRLTRRTWTILGAAFAAMTALGVSAHSITSFDLYAYAGASHAGIAAGYRPSDVPFTSDWRAVNAIYGSPIPVSPYGPVWLAMSYLVAGSAPGLGFALEALRWLEVASIVACVAALRALGVRPHLLAMFALNPAIFSNFVVDGHNDIFPVALVLAAAAIARRAPWLAVVLAGCAAGVKLPFLAVAPLAFVAEGSPRRRAAFALATLGFGCAISLLFGGEDYLNAMRQTAARYGANLADPHADAIRLSLLALAVGAIAAALTTRRFNPTIAWTFVAFGTSLFGWYLAWGLPYAVAERRWLGAFLASLPVACFCFSTTFAATTLASIVFEATLLAAPFIALLAVRRERFIALGAPAKAA